MSMTGKMFKTCAVSVALVTSATSRAPAVQAAVTYRAVAIVGDSAPGTETNTTFHRFSVPTINQLGQVAFKGEVTGPGLNPWTDVGIWSEGTGELSLVARGADAAPGTPPLSVYRLFSDPFLSNTGHITFFGRLRFTDGAPLVNDVGIWSNKSGSLSLVAREGNLAPDTPNGTTFSSFSTHGPVSDLLVNPSGDLVNEPGFPWPFNPCK